MHAFGIIHGHIVVNFSNQIAVNRKDSNGTLVREIGKMYSMDTILGRRIQSATLEKAIGQDNEVRLIDLFVNSISLKDYGFKVRFVPCDTGFKDGSL